MIILPVVTKDHAHDILVLVLNAQSIVRMRAGDPAQVKLKEVTDRLVNPTLMVCLEEDERKLAGFINANDVIGAMEYLTRGFEYRPDLGDHDHGPISLKDTQ